MFPNENAFDADVTVNASRYGIPVWVVKTTIAKESSFNPKATGPERPILSRGLMQLVPATAKGLGYKGILGNDVTGSGGLYEPGLSIALGTKLLAELRSRFPGAPWDDIYSAYQWGTLKRNSVGVLLNERKVQQWRLLADYFNPGWRSNPTEPAGL
jgi:soluble lytic murein transglycosylase-like protein